MPILSLAEIRSLPGVKHAGLSLYNEGRICIYIEGNGGNYAGERNARVHIDADGTLHVHLGRGSTSREWDDNLKAFKAAYIAATEEQRA